jgi:hypothetical protein
MSSISSIGTTSTAAADTTAAVHHHRRHEQAGTRMPPMAPPSLSTQPAEVRNQLADLVGGTDKLDALDQKIQAAVTEALGNNQGSKDPRQVVENAIDSTLKDNGLDVSAFRKVMASALPQHGGYNQAGGAVTMTGASGGAGSLMQSLLVHTTGDVDTRA